jgi:hypothetical protein
MYQKVFQDFLTIKIYVIKIHYLSLTLSLLAATVSLSMQQKQTNISWHVTSDHGLNSVRKIDRLASALILRYFAW